MRHIFSGYTAAVAGANGNGVGPVEVYDLDSAANSKRPTLVPAAQFKPRRT